jgi:hypothetical protein
MGVRTSHRNEEVSADLIPDGFLDSNFEHVVNSTSDESVDLFGNDGFWSG